MKDDVCSECRRPNSPRPGVRMVADDWNEFHRRRNYLGDSPPIDAAEYFRRTPARPPAMADVILPLTQAAATAIAFGLVAGVASLAYHWPWTVPAGIAATTFAAAWLILLRLNLESQFIVEHVRAAEPETAEPDTETPLPAVATTRLSVFLADDGLHEVVLPVPPATILTVAKSLAGGAKPWSKREWCGAGRLLSAGEYDELTAAFTRLGWLRWKDERYRQQGLELSPAGRGGMSLLASGRIQPEDVFQAIEKQSNNND